MQVLGDASLHGGKVKCVIWTAEWLISCGIAGVMFWDARCLELVRQCACPSPLCDLALWGCYAFGISASGSLLLFKPKCTRILPLDAEVFALSCVGELVVVGCTAGIIRLFQMATLAYVGDLPRPPPLGGLSLRYQNDSAPKNTEEIQGSWIQIVLCMAYDVRVPIVLQCCRYW